MLLNPVLLVRVQRHTLHDKYTLCRDATGQRCPCRCLCRIHANSAHPLGKHFGTASCRCSSTCNSSPHDTSVLVCRQYQVLLAMHAVPVICPSLLCPATLEANIPHGDLQVDIRIAPSYVLNGSHLQVRSRAGGGGGGGVKPSGWPLLRVSRLVQRQSVPVPAQPSLVLSVANPMPPVTVAAVCLCATPLSPAVPVPFPPVKSESPWPQFNPSPSPPAAAACCPPPVQSKVSLYLCFGVLFGRCCAAC